MKKKRKVNVVVGVVVFGGNGCEYDGDGGGRGVVQRDMMGQG